MKNYFKAIFILFIATALNAKEGCIDTSMHLTQRFDTKAEHFVNCNCPCDEYAQNSKQNQCFKCKHLHHAKRMEFTNKSEKGNPEAARWMALYTPAIAAAKR